MTPHALWLAIELPRFALDALGRSEPAQLTPAPESSSDLSPAIGNVDDCQVVTAHRGARRWIIASTDPTLSPGMDLGLARALRPNLRARARQPALEEHAFESLACAIYAFGNRIHWHTRDAEHDYGVPGYTLWLEIGASLKLFGGMDALLSAIKAELASSGYSAQLGIAPTLEAAAALARWRGATDTPARADALSDLPEMLATLPIHTLSLPLQVRELLLAIGVKTTGQLCALPRAELGRRVGSDTLYYLDRLMGTRPDSRRGYEPPTRFARQLDFLDEIEQTDRLVFPLRRLIGNFVHYLRARATGVQQFQLELLHARHRSDEHAPTPITIALSAPTRDEALLLRVLRERLANLVLPAPVHGLRLRADQFAAPRTSQHDLFDTRPQTDEQTAEVIDRLIARLGREAIWRPQLLEDHRPELAWCAVPLQATETPAATHSSSPRPTWLLRQPRRFERPPLILGKIERIESGWWDGADARRDYFVCTLDNGARGWAYQDHKDGQLYLHGLWG